MDIITLSIPLFFLLIAVEVVVAWRMRRKLYRLNDSLADLACGTISQIGGLFLKFASLGLYALVFQHAALLPAWPTVGLWGSVAWAVSFILVDHQYYWGHRMAHQTRLGWSTHVVHHSSEEYNLTVALRQSTFQTLFTAPFYLPLALLGMPPEMLAVNYALNLVYQFWIHTRVIDRLPGWFEAVMNTPSHHRVHHGRNLQYLDRNHAGVFIVWDKLYGTFEPEEDEVVYGITTPLNTWNPVEANLHEVRGLWADMKRTPSLWDKLRTPWMPPGWRAASIGGPFQPKQAFPSDPKYNPVASTALHVYVLLQFVVLTALALYMLLTAATAPLTITLALGAYVTAGMANLGALHDGRRWAATSEAARWIATLLAGFVLLWLRLPVPALLAVVPALVSLPWLFWVQRQGVLRATSVLA